MQPSTYSIEWITWWIITCTRRAHAAHRLPVHGAACAWGSLCMHVRACVVRTSEKSNSSWWYLPLRSEEVSEWSASSISLLDPSGSESLSVL